MLEIEAKYPLPDWTNLLDLLRAWGAASAGERVEVDHYFNAPDRDFAQTDEAFRLRRIGERACLTYKGPKLDTTTKTRTEIEAGILGSDAEVETMIRLLRALGYRPIAIVRKTRRVFHLQRDGFALAVCLDEVDEVGRFVELEIVAPAEHFHQGRAILLRTATELGLAEQERRSYLRMRLEKSVFPTASSAETIRCPKNEVKEPTETAEEPGRLTGAD